MDHTNNFPAAPEQPFNRMLAAHGGINAGSIAIEQERAIAEARGQMQLARMFPRDLNAAHAEIMDACKLPSMAAVAFYTVPQGAQKVTGASIKLIEQVASSCEHFEWGHRELSRIEAGPGPRDFGRSEIEVFAWDKQKNNVSKRQITVLHVMDTKEGPRKLRDQREIDNKIANVASKQMRGRLQAILPKWLIEAAIEECRKTLAGNNEKPISARVRDMTQAFAKYGVTTTHLESYIGHTLDQTTADELVDLTGVYNAIKEGSKPSDYFSLEAQQAAIEAESTAAAITNRGKAAAPRQAKPQPAQAAAAAPAPVAEPDRNSNPAETQNKTVKSESRATAQVPASSPAHADSDIPVNDAGDDDVF